MIMRYGYMGNTETDPEAIIKSLGYTQREARIIMRADPQTRAEFFAASPQERGDWLDSKLNDPAYTMDAAEYAAYVENQRAQAAAMREGEAARLKSISEARAASPEVAATVDPFGAVTEYGASKMATLRRSGIAPGTVLLFAGAGLAAFFLFRKRR